MQRPCSAPTCGCPVPSTRGADGGQSPAADHTHPPRTFPRSLPQRSLPPAVRSCVGEHMSPRPCGSRATHRRGPQAQTHAQAVRATSCQRRYHRALPRAGGNQTASGPADGMCCASLWCMGHPFGHLFSSRPLPPLHPPIHPSQGKWARSLRVVPRAVPCHHSPSHGRGWRMWRVVVPGHRSSAEDGDQPGSGHLSP